MTQSPIFGVVPTGSGAEVRQDFNLADQAVATEHEGPSAPGVTYPFMRWRDDTARLVRRRNAANSGWEIIENYGATTDPTTGDDAADGYIRGATWLNTSAARLFFCTNPATGAAVWVQAGGGGGGALSVFGRTGAVVATAGDYTADQISDAGGKVMMTAAERSTLATISFPARIIPLAGTASAADTVNIRAAIAAIKASGQPGELLMSGDFMIGSAGDLAGIDPDSCPYLKLTGRGYCRWYKGVAATTIGLTGQYDPDDGTAYPLLARDTDDGPGKTLIISNMIFEGDLETTMMQLGDLSRLIALNFYDRVELSCVEGRWASQMAFTFGYCNQVRANRIYLNRIARDGFNASNSADVAVTDSDFEWIIDDCCAANLSGGAEADAGQQRAFRFIGNRVYNAQGAKVLGGRHVMIANNSFRAPLNYAVYLGSDESYGEGARPIEDVLVSGNSITDLVTADQYGNPSVPVDTGILVSQFLATPRNVVIRGNNLAQRTATNGSTWSDLKLRGIDGENRQWRRDDATGNVLFYDPPLNSEIFVGQGKALRVEAPNGLDRLTYDVDDNRFDGFSDDAFLRSQPAWSGSQLWAVPALVGEFPIGAAAQITGLDLRGYQDMRLVLSVGEAAGLANTRLSWRFSIDGGATWNDTGTAIALEDAANYTYWGAWAPIPAALRQTIDAQLALFGQAGNGVTGLLVTAFTLDVRGIDQTSAARLLPSKVTPDELSNPVQTELRSFSPADVAAMVGGGGGGNGGGGASTLAFGRIVVEGQATVVATAAPDALTLAGSNGVVITTDAATDTVTVEPAYGTSPSTFCQGNDSRLSDARTPVAHATTHKSGGTDPIKLDELAAPTDVTTLNASTSAHGLLRKLDNNAAHYLDGTGAWSTPAGGGYSVGALTAGATFDNAADFVAFSDTSAGGDRKIAPKAIGFPNVLSNPYNDRLITIAANNTDVSAALRSALAAVASGSYSTIKLAGMGIGSRDASNGWLFQIPAGRRVAIVGEGHGFHLQHQYTTDTAAYTMFEQTAGGQGDVLLENLILEGIWARQTAKQEVDGSRGTDLRQFRRVRLHGVQLYDNTEMGLTAQDAGIIRIDRCHVERNTRDCINANGRDVAITHCTAAYSADDCFAIYVPSSAADGETWTLSAVVSDCRAVQTNGIKIAAPRVIVAGNRLSYCKLYGIRVFTDEANEGAIEPAEITIRDNHVFNLIANDQLGVPDVLNRVISVDAYGRAIRRLDVSNNKYASTHGALWTGSNYGTPSALPIGLAAADDALGLYDRSGFANAWSAPTTAGQEPIHQRMAALALTARASISADAYTIRENSACQARRNLAGGLCRLQQPCWQQLGHSGCGDAVGGGDAAGAPAERRQHGPEL